MSTTQTLIHADALDGKRLTLQKLYGTFDPDVFAGDYQLGELDLFIEIYKCKNCGCWQEYLDHDKLDIWDREKFSKTLTREEQCFGCGVYADNVPLVAYYQILKIEQ